MSSRTNGRLRALIIEHERPTPAGFVSDWLAQHDADVDELKIDVEDREVDPREYDLLVPLGSEHPPYADHIPAGRQADVSVLGICFGGQLLARALGSRCFRADVSEIGWLPVRSRDPELVPEGPWFQWHFDTFEPPRGAAVVAETEVGPQAFVVGRSLGVQFHPEVTNEIMEDWVRVYRHELDAEGVDPDALLAETYARADSARETSRRMLDAFLERVAKRPR